MAREVFLLDLRDEALAEEYEAWHRPGNVPASVLADITASDVTSMQIYRSGDRLVMITETGNGLSTGERALSQESRDWERKMDRFQRPLPWANGFKWQPADRIFDLLQHTKD